MFDNKINIEVNVMFNSLFPIGEEKEKHSLLMLEESRVVFSARGYRVQLDNRHLCHLRFGKEQENSLSLFS